MAYSHIHALPFLRNAFLFVDFFFALSGFVIAANYRAKLRQGFGVGRFMFLRWGRLYPLHFATLMFLVGMECLALAMPEVFGRSAFTGSDRDIGSLVSNLLLLQGIGFDSSLSWNFPSWTISAEFWTYFLFALAAVALPVGWLRGALLVVALAAPIGLGVLSSKNMAATYDYGILRAVGGFAAGAICFDVYTALRRLALPRPAAWLFSAAEGVLILGVVLFVSAAGQTSLSLFAPLVFSLTILLFSVEGGLFSRLLRSGPAILLGTLSYSIYMVHVPLQMVTKMLARAFERETGIPVFTPAIVGEDRVMMLGRTLWQGDVALMAILAATLIVSALTYFWIEAPCRRLTRRLVDRRSDAKSRAEPNLALPERAA